MPTDSPTHASVHTDVAELFGRQIHFVSGKGGVGKSAFACALAKHLTDGGTNKVLLAQVNAQDSHRRLLGLDRAVPPELLELEEGLVVVNIDPQLAMKEYALMTVKFESVYKMAFENRLTKAFLRFVPSLSELTQLGKIWFHAEEVEGGRSKYDHVVVDLPSTGHGLGLLRVARVIREVSNKGPMAEKTREMETTFQDPTRACLHVVTLPEELPANEALELLDEARREAVVPVGACVVNQVNHPIFDPSARMWAEANLQSDDELVRSCAEVSERRMTREALERTTLERLTEETLGAPRITLPFLASEEFGPLEVSRLQTLLARSVSAAKKARGTS